MAEHEQFTRIAPRVGGVAVDGPGGVIRICPWTFLQDGVEAFLFERSDECHVHRWQYLISLRQIRFDVAFDLVGERVAYSTLIDCTHTC